MKSPLRRAPGNTESGFTLIEILIAMAILGVGLLSIAVAQLTAIKVSSRSKHLQQAMLLARETMDDFEALPDGHLVLQSASTIDDPNNPLSLAIDPSDVTTYTRTTEVTPNQPSAGLTRVVVTVVWDTAQGGGTRQVQLTSVKRMN